jgi:hypothetical protein
MLTHFPAGRTVIPSLRFLNTRCRRSNQTGHFLLSKGFGGDLASNEFWDCYLHSVCISEGRANMDQNANNSDRDRVCRTIQSSAAGFTEFQ